MSCVCSRALLALGVSVLPLTVAAQDGDSRPPARTEPEIGLDTISVKATKTAAAPIDTLAGTSVVTRAQIERLQPSRLSTVLRDVPGVTTQENPNDHAQAINIRGLQDFGRVNVLIDGARQDFQTSGHGANGVFYLDPELVGGVDITRGPSATIYGSGAIGGVAAFRTRSIDDILKPDETAGFVQKQGFGTNGQRFVNSSALGARIGTAADVFGQFVFRNTAPYRDGLGSPVPDTGSELTAGLEIYGTYAEGYRAPSITETLVQGLHPFPAFTILPNLALRPEVAHTVEGGVNLRADALILPEDAFRAKLAVFDNTVDNFINMKAVGPTYYVPAIPGIPPALCSGRPGRFPCVIPVQSYQYRNLARAELTGVELEGTDDWGRDFVTLAAAYIDGRDRATRESLLTVPPARLSTMLGLRFLGNGSRSAAA